LPEKDFTNRELELAYIGRLAELSGDGIASNIAVEGARGIGKTELLKQLYRRLFWNKDHVVPFYYSFQRAALGGESFARDYFSRFVRQFAAYVRQDPLLAQNLTMPLRKLMPVFSETGHGWMIETMEDLKEQLRGDDSHSGLLGSISAPLVAASRTGMPVMVMLDDFHLATLLYRDMPGDVESLVSLFEEPIKSPLCPHVLSGSPEGVIETILSDDSLRGTTERMTLKALPEDKAFEFFSGLCAKLGLTVDSRLVKFMGLLGGNPLYIRNMARALLKLKRTEPDERDILECYAHEVTSGDTAFYWSSVLEGILKDPKHLAMAVELLMRTVQSGPLAPGTDRLAQELGVREEDLAAVVSALARGGMLKTMGGLRVAPDPVFEDFIMGLHLKHIKGVDEEKVKNRIQSRRQAIGEEITSFEMVIPAAQDSELVAAKAVEQIFSAIKLKPELTSRLQLAIIEACLNALEHSGGYEKKARLKVSASPKMLEITIESPGRPYVPEGFEKPSVGDKIGSARKRGWGLSLMREIMDEVKFKPYENGTRVVLKKKLSREEVLD
jgi:anti-sigma regulatory factor (Ser/Thr protein kinase)